MTKPNLRRIEALADHLATLKHKPRTTDAIYVDGELDIEASKKLNKDRFHMGNWEFDCGAPACVAGWAAFKYGKAPGTLGVSDAAAEALNIDYEWAMMMLFAPDGVVTKSLNEITPKQAAAALRRVAKWVRKGKDYQDMEDSDVWGRALTNWEAL